MGTVTAGIPRVLTNGEIGIEPPLVLIIIGSSPKPFLRALLSHRPTAESKDVR